MHDIFIKLIEQLNSCVFVLLAILILAFYIIYKIGSWKQTFSFHGKRIDKMENAFDKIISLETKVDLIYQYSNPNATVRASSPANLTKVGLEIAEKIKADDIFKKYATKLVNLVENKKPKNAYDIQQVAFDVCKKEFLNFLNENELKIIKDEAFSKGLLMEDITLVFGILLRNKILEDKNIPIAEVDKHAKKD